MRRPTLFTLLSLTLILALWAAPSFAQAAPAHAAPAPAIAAPAAPAPAVAAPVAPAFALAGLATGASTCAATAPFLAPAIFCPHCPPGYTLCGPICHCCNTGGL